MKWSISRKSIYIISIIILILVVASALIISTTYFNRTGSQHTTTSSTPFPDSIIHTGKTEFALVSPASALTENPQFVQMAKQYYRFEYADAANFSLVDNASFVALVAGGGGSSLASYQKLAIPLAGNSTYNYAVKIGGLTLTYKNVWNPGQTVFVLAGYASGALGSALDSFFVRAPVYLPGQIYENLTVANDTAKDPVLDATYGNLPLNPSDPYFNSTSPYSYYLNLVYWFYYAPMEFSFSTGDPALTSSGLTPLSNSSGVPPGCTIGIDESVTCTGGSVSCTISSDEVSCDGAFTGSGYGNNLPQGSNLCFPPGNPSICWGVYSAVPMFDLGQAGVLGNIMTPSLNLSNADCSAFFLRCIGVKGNISSGYDSNSGAVSLVTGKFYAEFLQQYFQNVKSTTLKQLMRDGVVTYSTDVSNVLPCQYNQCSSAINFPVALYSLVDETANIPEINANVSASDNYSALFEPVTLIAPAKFTNATGTYGFVAWNVYSEVGANNYYQQFNSSSATFELAGPTQARAVYAFEYSNPPPPPPPASLEGKVEFYHTYGSNITGLPIRNAVITLSATLGGEPIATVTSNDTGYYVTPLLPAGCYFVNATKPGYYLEPSDSPVCLVGKPVVDDVYDRYFFYFYGFGPAGFEQAIRANQSVNLYFQLLWPGGTQPGSVPILASTTSGTITSQAITNRSGIATFKWTAGSVPGNYNVNFIAINTGTVPLNYTIPVTVFSSSYKLFRLNITTPSKSYSTESNSSLQIPFALSSCQTVYDSSIGFICNPSSGVELPPADLTLTGLPAGSSATFAPNPASLYSILTLHLPSGVGLGNYTIRVTAKTKVPGYYLPPVSNSTTFRLTVMNCTNGFGGISGEVLNRDGNLPMTANVTVYFGSREIYSANTTTGLFNTGYILKPGTYNVTAYASPGVIYDSELVNVTTCSDTSVFLTPDGGLSVQVNYNGSPAANANITITGGPYNIYLYRPTNVTGGYSTGYTLPTGSYTIVASYNGHNTTVNFQIKAAEITTVTLSIP